MPINLLPSEEKNKSSKIRYQPTPIVEMTGPIEVKKNKPAVKRGGVLGFFKQAFAKPKPLAPDAETPLPEKKVMVEERIIFEKQKPQAAPRPIIKMVAPKPEGMQVRSSSTIGERMGNFFRSIFAAKPKAPVSLTAAPTPVKNEFPKYQPVHTEKVLAEQPLRKSKPIEVFTVTTNGRQPESVRTPSAPHAEGHRVDIPYEGFPKVDPAFKVIKQTSVPVLPASVVRVSVWQKISAWFKRMFARAPKQKIVTPVQPEATIPPKSSEPRVVVRTEQKMYTPQKPSPQPPPPPHKPEVAAHTVMPPFTRQDFPVKQNSGSMPTADKIQAPPPPARPIAIPIPPMPVTVKPPPAPIKPATAPILAPVPPVTPKQEVKKESGMPWWKKIWASIVGLFGRKEAGRKKGFLKLGGSVQNIPGVRLTEIKENGSVANPIEWEVNLVPEEASEKELPISKILIGILCVFISAGIVFGGWIAANYYYYNVTAKASGLNGQIASNRIEINGYQQVQKEVRELNQVMSNINTLINKHVYWSEIFNKLENYTVSEVYYTSLTADVNGAVSLNAYGQNYESAIKQLEVFKRATHFVNKVTVTNICFITDEKCAGTSVETLLITPTDETVKFSVNLMIQPTIFYWPK
ncbi:MAG: hypothetical protein WCT27_00995 [Patescibacteria group bacterium]